MASETFVIVMVAGAFSIIGGFALMAASGSKYYFSVVVVGVCLLAAGPFVGDGLPYVGSVGAADVQLVAELQKPSGWQECVDAALERALNEAHTYTHQHITKFNYDLAVCDRQFPGGTP